MHLKPLNDDHYVTNDRGPFTMNTPKKRKIDRSHVLRSILVDVAMIAVVVGGVFGITTLLQWLFLWP